MNKGIWIFILVSNFSSIFLPTNGAKILALFSTPSKSHVIVHTSLMRELAERGHIVGTRLLGLVFVVIYSFPL